MTNDAPHSAPTPLSRFLGGWMRHPSPQEPEQSPADGAAEASASDVAEAEAQAHASKSSGPVEGAADPESSGESEPPGHDSPVSAGVEDSQDTESAESSENAEDAEDLDAEEEHVIEVADPRDFADDSGPQYEDEDFDDIVDGEAAPAPGPIGTATPAITYEEASEIVDGTLTPLLSSGLTVNTADAGAQSKNPGAAAAFSPQDTAEMLKISSEGGNLSATFDPTALRDGVVARVGQVETPAQNATWKIDGSATGAPGARPQYVPAAQGKVIDTAALSASLLKAGTTATDAAGRTVTLPMVVAEPTVTTPQNEWGISETIGEFATPYNAGDAPRTQNLTRGAELVNGTVVKPGEVFSLEKTLGEVDYEHGFADAGVISNGQHVDSLGGGLSQVATTVFNAGFEAGMDDTEHHAHQYYFDRYPAGREATLWTGKLDVKFTNSTSNSVLVQAWLDGEQIHVRMWSTKYYDVSITSSERFNFRPVSTERKSGPGCEPYSGGNPGFDITVTRTRKHDGKAVPDDVITTKYDGDIDMICN